jgi:parallel beta-helix repeat protein
MAKMQLYESALRIMRHSMLRLMVGLFYLGAAFLGSATISRAAVEKPGPSVALFSSPYYHCVNNYYVSSAGKDNGPGTAEQPWLTLQRANDARVSAGGCVNVEPGTYSGVVISNGGNLASSTGYLVYRCISLNGCTIRADAGVNGNAGFFFNTTQPMANYVIIDGFVIKGSNTPYGQGIEVWNANVATGSSQLNSSHHIWIINNKIYDNGQSGLQMNDGEYFYVIHNSIYGNAGVTCDAQGSGISFVALKEFRGYTPTADDRTNPNPLIGSFDAGTTFFHNVVGWNVVHTNALTKCGKAGQPDDTDGNNIILDTFNNTGGSNIPYTDQTLVAFNITYNAGGGGIHIYRSEYITVANNSCYHNYLDPFNSGSARSCIDTNDSFGNTIINNIAIAVPAAPSGACAFGIVPYTQFNAAITGGGLAGKPLDMYSNNITQLQGLSSNCWAAFGEGGPNGTGEVPMFNGNAYSPQTNRLATSPRWVDVGDISVGSETTEPQGANFALKPDSAAIGYGLIKTYLSPQSVDVGACYHSLAQCP